MHLRVWLRRLRSILAGFSAAFPEDERRALGDRLRAVAQRYGRAREWDVLLSQHIVPLRTEMPGEPALAALERLAREARRAALPPGETLTSGLAAAQAAVAAASWLRRPAHGTEAVWAMPLRDYAAPVLDQRHRKLRKRLKHADHADAAAFHRLRIRVKKLRYPAELMKSLFDRERAEAYLDRLVALQDVMGQMNDMRVGAGLVASVAPPSAAQALLADRMAHETALCRERFPACARAFRQADPFWR